MKLIEAVRGWQEYKNEMLNIDATLSDVDCMLIAMVQQEEINLN